VVHERPDLRALAAARAGLPAGFVVALARDPSAPVRVAVAVRPDLPPGLLWLLALDEDPAVRRAVAARPLLPAPLAQRLALDNDAAVRCAVASRPDLSVRLSQRLAGDAKAPVRAALARHSAHVAVLRRLASAREGSVREGVQANRLAPPFVRERLRRDGVCACGGARHRASRGRRGPCTFHGAPSRLPPRARHSPHAGGLARALGRS
jgi:hypothetical protein